MTSGRGNNATISTERRRDEAVDAAVRLTVDKIAGRRSARRGRIPAFSLHLQGKESGLAHGRISGRGALPWIEPAFAGEGAAIVSSA